MQLVSLLRHAGIVVPAALLLTAACSSGSDTPSGSTATPVGVADAAATSPSTETTSDAGVDASSDASTADCVSNGESGFGGRIHGSALTRSLDRSTGATSTLSGLIDATYETATIVPCGQEKQVVGVRVRVDCVESKPVDGNYRADVKVTIVSDATFPSRAGQSITFPHHCGFYDSIDVWFREDAAKLDAMAAYVVLD